MCQILRDSSVTARYSCLQDVKEKPKQAQTPTPGQGEGQLPPDLDADQGMHPGLLEWVALSPEARLEFVRSKQAEAN